MKFSEESGIRITEEVRKLVNHAIEIAGSQNRLHEETKISQVAISYWTGKGNRKGEIITWDQWKPLRDYLAARGKISATDPQWMLPSELRNALETVSAARDDDEARLLQLYRALTPDGQQTALNLMQSLQATLNKAPSGSAASPASPAPSAPSAG